MLFSGVMKIPFFGKSEKRVGPARQVQQKPSSRLAQLLAERLFLRHNPAAILSKRPSLLRANPLVSRKPFRPVSTVRMKGPAPKFAQTKATTRTRE